MKRPSLLRPLEWWVARRERKWREMWAHNPYLIADAERGESDG
jgi:hypothetical protein